MARKLALVASLAFAAALGACTPEHRTEASLESGGRRASPAPVQSGTAAVGSRARTRGAASDGGVSSSDGSSGGAPSGSARAGSGDSRSETDVTEVPRAPEATGRPAGEGHPQGGSNEESVPVGPQAVGGSRAKREQIVEADAAEDRPAGRSEARFEADGTDYRPGLGFFPRYRIRTIDRVEGPPPPDPVLEKVLPGAHLDLPPPEKPKPVVVEKAAEPIDSEPHPVVPKPAN